MKKLLLIALVLTGISTNAQFFQRFYGTNNSNDQLTHGINTNALGFGHFMVGNSFLPNGTMPLMAVRTDQNGGVLPPYFNNKYLINAGATNLFARRARAFEIPGGVGFGILVEIRGIVDGLAYLTINPAGNVTGIVRHFSSPGFTIELGNVVVNDLTNIDACAVGTMVNNNVNPPERYVFAYNFNINTGAINWSNYYDHVNPGPNFNSNAYDCDQISGSNMLGIAGKANGISMMMDDNPFYMMIDINAGAPMAPSMVYDFSPGVNDALTAIDYSTATGLYAVSGNIALFGQTDAFTMLLVPPGFPVWGTVQQYMNTSSSSTNVNTTDILTRTNTAGLAEFYVSGTATNGNLLNTDAFVYKIDANLQPVGQFTYGNALAGEGIALDGYDGTPTDGLSTFANLTPPAANPNQDFHLVKSYFNGLSGCNEDLQVPILQNFGPPFFGPLAPIIVPNVIFSSSVLNVSTPTPNVVGTLCFSTSIGGGSNAKVAPIDDNKDRVAKLSPNPMTQGTQAVLLEINTVVPVDVEIAIYDMIGRQYYSGRQSLTSGNNRLPIDVSGANMAQGTYIMKVTGVDFNENITLLVK